MINDWMKDPKNININWEMPDHVDGFSYASGMQLVRAAAEGKTIFNTKRKGEISKEVFTTICDLLEKDGGKLLWEKIPSRDYRTYIFDHGAVHIALNEGRQKGDITVTSSDEEFVVKYRDLIESHIPKHSSSNIMMILQDVNGFNLQHIGDVGEPIKRNNYESQVNEYYDYIKEQLQNRNPAGRISILEGAPGTGKSYFIRGLLDECKDARFAFIPSSMVGDLATPSFITCLTKAVDNYMDKKPLVLVVEDADSVIANRDAKGVNTLSSLLNMSDGMLGQILDIRVIASTNAKRVDIDDAILRPGRLCAHVAFEALSYEKANDIFKNLSGGDDLPEIKRYTLAEVYGEFNKSRAQAKEDKKFGQYV